MPRYVLAINETVRTNFLLSADNEEEALEKGRDGYFSRKYVVSPAQDVDVDEVLLEVIEENSTDGHFEQLYIVGERKGTRQSYPPRERGN